MPKFRRVKQKTPERRRSPFAPLPVRALLDESLPDGAIRTLGKVAMWCNRAGITWVSQKKIAQMTGQHQQVISRHIVQLKQRGYVQVIRKGWKGLSGDTIRIVYDPTISTQDAISVASSWEDCRPPFIKKAEQDMQSIPPKKQREIIDQLISGVIKPVNQQRSDRRYTMPKDGETLATKAIRAGLKRKPKQQPKAEECDTLSQVKPKGCLISLKDRGYVGLDKVELKLLEVVEEYVPKDLVEPYIDAVLARCDAEGLPKPRIPTLLEAVLDMNANRLIDGR